MINLDLLLLRFYLLFCHILRIFVKIVLFVFVATGFEFDDLPDEALNLGSFDEFTGLNRGGLGGADWVLVGGLGVVRNRLLVRVVDFDYQLLAIVLEGLICLMNWSQRCLLLHLNALAFELERKWLARYHHGLTTHVLVSLRLSIIDDDLPLFGRPLGPAGRLVTRDELWELGNTRPFLQFMAKLVLSVELFLKFLNFLLHLFELFLLSGLGGALAEVGSGHLFFIAQLLVLGNHLELGNFLLLLHTEAVGALLHVIALLDAEVELSEGHILLKLRLLNVYLERARLIIFVLLACLLVGHLWFPMSAGGALFFLPFDHLHDLLSVSFMNELIHLVVVVFTLI